MVGGNMEAFESTRLFVVTNLPPCDICESDLRPLFCRGDGGRAADVQLVDIHLDKDARSAFVAVDSREYAVKWTDSNVAFNGLAFGDSHLGVQQLCQETVSLELSACVDSRIVRMTKSLAEEGNLNLVRVSEDAIAVRGSFAAIQRLRADLRANVLKATATAEATTMTTSTTHSDNASALLRLHPMIPILDRQTETGKPFTYELDVDLVAEMPVIITGLNQDMLLFMAKVPEGNIEGARYNPSMGEVIIAKPTKEEVELCRAKVMALYESLFSPCPNHVRTTSVKVPPEKDAQTVDSIVAQMNQQHARCVLYPEFPHQVKIVSNSVETLSHAKVQLLSLLLIPTTDMFTLDGGRNLTIKKGKIECENTTALVCPSNSRLQYTSGVASDINEASQGTLQKKSNDIVQKCEALTVGNIVMVTGGGALKSKNVYLVVLPDGSCGPRTSYTVVQDTVLKLLGYVERHKIQSIALPLLTSEVFYDENVVAKLMVEAIIDHKFDTKLPVLSDIVICVASEADFIFLTRYLHQKKMERLECSQSYNESLAAVQPAGGPLPAMSNSGTDGQHSSVPSPAISDSVWLDIEPGSLAETNLKINKMSARDYGVCPICKRTPAAGVVTTTCCHQICCHDCWKKLTTNLSNKCLLCKPKPEAMTITYPARTQNDLLEFNTSQALYHHFKDYW